MLLMDCGLHVMVSGLGAATHHCRNTAAEEECDVRNASTPAMSGV